MGRGLRDQGKFCGPDYYSVCVVIATLLRSSFDNLCFAVIVLPLCEIALSGHDIGGLIYHCP